MKRDRCPACGSSGYHGRRCRVCNYVPFTEIVSHENHYHAGEPLVVTDPRTIRRSTGNSCKSYGGKRLGIPKVLLIIAGILLLILFPSFAFVAIILYFALKKKKK